MYKSTLHFRHLLPAPGTNIFTLQFITYPDIMYKVATAAILIQTRCVQRVFSLEKELNIANFISLTSINVRSLIISAQKKENFS